MKKSAKRAQTSASMRLRGYWKSLTDVRIVSKVGKGRSGVDGLEAISQRFRLQSRQFSMLLVCGLAERTRGKVEGNGLWGVTGGKIEGRSDNIFGRAL
jgi:hypothetical protein